MGGIFSRPAYRIRGNPGVFRDPVPVSRNGNGIILIYVVKGQGTGTAEVLRADSNTRRHGHNVGMHIGCAFYHCCFQLFIVGDIRAEFVGHVANRYRSASRMGFRSGYLYGNINYVTAGCRSNFFLCIITQIFFAGRIHLARFQIRFIGIVLFPGNILAGHGDFTGYPDFICPADITVICVFQIRISQGPGTGKAVFRASKTQCHGCIHLCQGILARYFHILYVRIGSALNTALDIIIYFTYRRHDTGRNCPSVGSRIGVRNIYTAGNLYVTVIGAVVDSRFTGGI